MATSNIDLVQQLYVAYYNRPADVAGLNFWVKALESGATIAQISKEFNTAPEYTALFAGKSADAVVDTVYMNLFGRHAEAGGLDFWGPKVASGAITTAGLVTEFLKGAVNPDGTPNADAVAFANKVTVANAFTTEIGIPGNEAQRLAYTSADAATLANIKAFIGGVTTDPATLAAALANVKAIAAAAIPPAPGSNATLTQGLDTITTGVGNDTINAYAFNSATGSDVTTLNSVDSIDGGAGIDTLFIEVKDADGAGAGTTNLNGTIQGTIKNVEKIIIDNTAAWGATLAAVDASKFQGATSIQQVAQASAVTNLAATTTAGFKGTAAAVSVTAAATAAAASVALDAATDATTLAVGGAALKSVTVSGTVVDGADVGTVVNSIALTTTVGSDVESLAVNAGVAVTLAVTQAVGATKNVSTVDASASTGAVTFNGADVKTSAAASTYSAVNVKTGSGNDIVTVIANTNVASGSTAAVGATVSTGAGNDQITVDTANAALGTATGTTTIDAGAGNDTVGITTRSSGKLSVSLGDGTDTFTSNVAIAATDAIDAGAGVDTLLLKLVGSANVGAFSNFDLFDVAAMTNNLDLDILNAKNTVTEIVGSAALAAASVTLQNVGAGVNFRATGDMFVDTDAGAPVVPAALTLTQKTAGALTVTLDADETGTADTTIDTAYTNVVASNATSLKAVFDTSFLAAIANETAAGDNVSTIALSGAAATTLEIVSGGALSSNVLTYTDTAATAGKLASLTVTGARALDLTFSSTNPSSLATVDSSASTGGLTFSLENLKNGGTVKLGSGVDHITVTNTSTGDASFESIQGLEKTAAVAVSVAAGDAAAAAAALADADTIVLSAGAAVADANAGVTTGTIAKGVLTFTGAGPATLADAIAVANAAADAALEAVAFQYVGNTYVFMQGGAAVDTVVQLVGVTGVTNFGEVNTAAAPAAGADHFFIV